MVGPAPWSHPRAPLTRRGSEGAPEPCPPPADYNLAVPQHLEELYEVYLRELEEGSLERATIMDRVASRALQVGAWACADVHANASREMGPGRLVPQGAHSLSFLPHPKPGQV